MSVGAALLLAAVTASAPTSTRVEGFRAHEVAAGFAMGGGLAFAQPDFVSIAVPVGLRGEYAYRAGDSGRLGAELGVVHLMDGFGKGGSLTEGTLLASMGARWEAGRLEIGPRLALGLAAGSGGYVRGTLGWAFDAGLEIAGRGNPGPFVRASLFATSLAVSRLESLGFVGALATFGLRFRL